MSLHPLFTGKWERQPEQGPNPTVDRPAIPNRLSPVDQPVDQQISHSLLNQQRVVRSTDRSTDWHYPTRCWVRSTDIAPLCTFVHVGRPADRPNRWQFWCPGLFCPDLFSLFSLSNYELKNPDFNFLSTILHHGEDFQNLSCTPTSNWTIAIRDRHTISALRSTHDPRCEIDTRSHEPTKLRSEIDPRSLPNRPIDALRWHTTSAERTNRRFEIETRSHI